MLQLGLYDCNCSQPRERSTDVLHVEPEGGLGEVLVTEDIHQRSIGQPSTQRCVANAAAQRRHAHLQVQGTFGNWTQLHERLKQTQPGPRRT